MATIHLAAGNEGPVNEGEQAVLAFLAQNLPDNFELHPNLQISVGRADLVVRRGFSDAIEGGSSSLDLGDDVVDGLGPHERLRVVVPV